MAAIYNSKSPLARCSQCGVQRQFHTASDVPHSADRDHDFTAETIEDFEPGDLTPAQLVDAIDGAAARWQKLTNGNPTDADWDAADKLDARAKACRTELRERVLAVFGVDWEDLTGALS